MPGPDAEPLETRSDLNFNPLQHERAMGQSSSSESKGLKPLKRAVPYMRGAANSFGFRRTNNKNAQRADDKAALGKRDYSQEVLAMEQHDVTTSIKASPHLVRTERAEPASRMNRFGFRAPVVSAPNGRGLSNKVADSSAQVLSASPASPGPAATSTPVAVPRPSGPSGPALRALRPAPAKVRGPLAVTKKPSSPRPAPPSYLPLARNPPPSHLPRPQFAASARSRASKEAKTVANYGARRGLAPIATFDDEIGSSKESSMNEDSGLGSQLTGDTDTLHGIDILDISPRSGQKLRRITSAPPRRSLRDDDDEPNVITQILPISKVVSKASLKSLNSLGANAASPQLSLRASVKSASSDEFHSDSGLFKDYGEGLDDRTEEKVYRDFKTAEKRLVTGGRFMKDYGPEEQDEDWGQGEAMADGEWKDVVSGIIVDDDVGKEVKELQSTLFKGESNNLAELVAASTEHGLIEDESAPEDSLFSSSPPSTSDDSPSKHSPPGKSSRRKIRTKKRDVKDNDQGQDTVSKLNKICDKTAEKKREGHTLSPEGSGTPSNSFSLSDGRDFLIDDEIIDQPALTIHNKLHGDDSEMASITDSAASITLRDSSHHQALRSLKLAEGKQPDAGADLDGHGDVLGSPRTLRAPRTPSLDHGRQRSRDNTMQLARFGSEDSLATNSIDSEDLMMDFEEETSVEQSKKYHSFTKSWGGSPVTFWPRPRKAKSFSVIDLDQLKSVQAFVDKRHSVDGMAGMADADVLRELTSLIESVHSQSSPPGQQHRDRTASSLARQARMPSGPSLPSLPSSAPDSPRLGLASGSLTSSGAPSSAPSPLRPPRQLASSDSDESAMMRVDRGTYQHMFQDVVHIKTMLLKLKRVLQDAETLNPFESSLKNGLLHQLVQADDSGGNEDGKSANPEEEVLDLKRQMVLMKQQLEEKDRTIQLMQIQMRKYENVSDHSNENGPLSDTCNAATQTERSRPVSAGPSLLSSLPSDSNGSPLVSWTDTWGRRSRTPAGGGTITESKSSPTSKVPTVITRNSRSLVPGHQRPGFGTSGDNSPSSIPQVKGSHRKTGTTSDSVPNFRRLPVVAAPRKTSLTQKP